MATMWRVARQAFKLNVSFCKYHEFRRTLLSEAYLCNDVWNKRLQLPAMNELNFGELAVKMRRKFMADGRNSVIDMDILANRMNEMDDSVMEIVEDIIKSYRESPDAFPVRDSIVHGIIRSYMEINQTSRLLQMFTNRPQYGLFPDYYSANVLMDHFLKKNQFKEAAVVSYYFMSQEDFSHPLSHLLSMLSCVKHLKNLVQDLDKFNQEDPPDDPEEEEKWVAVNVIVQPYYDDHFDITNDQFLLGKTLTMIGSKEGSSLLGRSLQLTGLGLYNKFPKALKLLKEWMASSEKDVIMEETLRILQDTLDKALTRDPDEPEKEINIRTKHDEMKKLRMTPVQKETFLKELKTLTEELQSGGRLSSQNLEVVVEEMVRTEAPQYEAPDIAKQRELFEQWEAERVEMFDEQMKQYMKRQVEKEIVEKLCEIQEQEEVLQYFENREKIALAQRVVPWKETKQVKELTEDELEEKLRQRKSFIRRRKR